MMSGACSFCACTMSCTVSRTTTSTRRRGRRCMPPRRGWIEEEARVDCGELAASDNCEENHTGCVMIICINFVSDCYGATQSCSLRPSTGPLGLPSVGDFSWNQTQVVLGATAACPGPGAACLWARVRRGRACRGKGALRHHRADTGQAKWRTRSLMYSEDNIQR